MREVGQHHGQMRAPVAPLLLSAALYKNTRIISQPKWNNATLCSFFRGYKESWLTVADAGILPDMSWYTVCRGSLMGKLFANLNKQRHIKYYIYIRMITIKLQPLFNLRYLVMTRACVLLSILLANSRAWPHRPPFMAASSASYSHRKTNRFQIS